MKHIIGLYFICLLLSSCNSDKGWESLFNGEDLTGWTVYCQPQDRDKIFWTVDEGTILCNSIDRKEHNYVWLATEREFSDFELRLKFQAYPDSPGNSGVQFRSRYDTSGKGGGWLNGPQVDINPPKPMTWRTGLIYDETFEVQRWIYPSLPDSKMPAEYEPKEHLFKYAGDGDGWNELIIICKGMHIKTIVNGIVSTDWDATGILDSENHQKHNIDRSGHIAFQLHSGDQVRIRFKDIHIKEL